MKLKNKTAGYFDVSFHIRCTVGQITLGEIFKWLVPLLTAAWKLFKAFQGHFP